MRRPHTLPCAVMISVLIFIFLPLSAAWGEVTFTPTVSPKIEGPVSDTAAASDGKLIFFLTPGEIQVYQTEKGTIIDRFAVDKAYDGLTYTDARKALILTSSRGKTPQVYRVDLVHEILLEGLPIKGPEDAPVTIAVFSDYQCPYCARMDGFLQQVMARYPGKIRFVMKHFPLPSHKYARQASLAALAANRQGKFWAFHEALFKHYKEIDDKKIEEIAKGLGLDLDRWHKDMDGPAIEATIDRDLENGNRIGVGGTPTVFVNGKEAGVDKDFFQQIEAEIGSSR
ncbi:MAG: thioredoxin domain-containing protein [Desulfobacterales bacterium]|nr:thioredoxin domain-containing protein [Desulfobacterales bacterium]